MTRPEIRWPRHTDRLDLRLPTESSLEHVLGWRNRPEVTRWLLTTTVEPAAYRRSWLEGIDDPHDHSVIAHDRTGRVVGTVSIEVHDPPLGQPGMPGRCLGHLGYTVDPAASGRGYASEMARAMLDLAFGELGLRRVIAGLFADNVASRRVLEKLGMRREEHSVKDSWHAELGWVDGMTYGILAEEWPTLVSRAP